MPATGVVPSGPAIVFKDLLLPLPVMLCDNMSKRRLLGTFGFTSHEQAGRGAGMWKMFSEKTQ